MKSKRKSTGGIDRSHSRSDKKLSWKGGQPALTTIAAEREITRTVVEGLGSTEKVKLKLEKTVNATNPKDNKTRKLEIQTVVQNKADRQFARRNIVTKGAIIKAKDGDKEVFVTITSRPGQHGTIHGKILENFVPEKERPENKEKAAEKSEKAKKAPKKAKKEQ